MLANAAGQQAARGGGRGGARARRPRGKYQLKEMVAAACRCRLNHPFDLMKQGEVKRSVIVYE